MRNLVIGAALLALAACNRATPDASGGASANGAAPQGPPQMTITTPEGKAEIRTGGAAAAGMPAGLPAYPGADTTNGVNISGSSAQGQGGVQSFRTSDPPGRVVDFYATAAEQAGFRIANRMTLGATTSALTAQRGDQAVNITATEAGGTTQVQIIYTTQR